MKKFVRCLFGILFFIIHVVPEIVAEDISTTKLAIVDVGTKKEVPQPFMDLLTVTLSNFPRITLLERIEINKLLQEHALSLSMSGAIDSKNAVKAGQLWATDAFLMLDVNKTSASDIMLRIRLVDTHYGLKIWDSGFILGPQSKTYQTQAETLAKATAQKLAKIRDASDGLMMIGVTAVRSEEISKRWDWLSETLATGIEQHLILFPGMVLMERTKTRTLTEERELVEGLPEALRASAVLVDGAYKIVTEKGPNTISLYLRCRRNNKILLEEQIEGSAEELDKLYQKAASLVVSNIGKKADSEPMDPTIEAEMLAEEVKAYLTRSEPERALPPAEAALALVPHSLEYNELLLRALNTALGKYYLDLRNDYSEKKRIDWCNRSIELILRASPLAEYIVSKTDSHGGYFSNQIDGYFNATLNLFSPLDPYKYRLHLDDKTRESFNETRQYFWRIYYICHSQYKGKFDAEHERLLYYGSRAFHFCPNIEDAIRFSRQMLSESVKLLRAHPEGPYNIRGLYGLVSLLINSFELTEWLEEKDVVKRVAGYLDEQTHSEDPLIQLHAEKASIYFYGSVVKDIDKSKIHCENFIKILKFEILEYFPKSTSSEEGYLTIVNSPLSNDEKIHYFQDLLKFVYEKGASNHGVHTKKQWVWCTHKVAEHLEKENKLGEARDILQKGIAEFSDTPELSRDLTNKLRALCQRHPEIVKKDTERYNTNPVLSLKNDSMSLQLKGWNSKGVHFRRLVPNYAGFTIVYSRQLESGEHVGVIWLDKESLEPLSFQSSPVAISFKTKSADWELEYYRYGPAVAADKEDIYIGFPQGGIMAFYKDGGTKLMNEENGLASNNIQSLDILDGKLYAVVGEWRRDSGLMEIDLRTGVSKILFSSRSKDSKAYLNGDDPVLKIAADPKEHAIWLAAHYSFTWDVSLYYPKEQKFVNVIDTSIKNTLSFSPTYVGKFNDSLYVGAVNGLIIFDLNSKKIVPLFLEHGRSAKFSKWKYPDIEPRKVIVTGKNLVCADTLRLGYFRDDNEQVEYIWETKYPQRNTFIHPPDSVQDIAMSKKGLLLLIKDILYLIPEIR